MFSNNHSSLNSSSLKSFNTPLKASVLLVTAIMLSACGSDSDNSYNLKDIFDGNPTVTPGGSDGATGGNTGATGDGNGATGDGNGATGGDTGATGGDTGATGGDTGATGGDTGATGGDTGATGGDTGATGGDTGATGGDTGATGGNTGATGGDTGATGGDTGATGGDTGATGGDTGATGGDTGATGGDTGPTYQSGSDTAKSGVQNLNVNVVVPGLLNEIFKTTTRDFKATNSSVTARADLASEESKLVKLEALPITTSGSNDQALVNGFMSHKDSTDVQGSLAGSPTSLPLTYTSVYKDFGTQMRIGHINGKAIALEQIDVPVDGVAVIGNKTLTLPTEGSVSYGGDATYRRLGLDNAIEYGSSAFTADFTAKKVDGTLKFSKAGDIGISATISGSEFSGAKNGYTTEGAFYGDDAKYLGGIYSNDSAQGTYGAEKK